MAGAVPLPEHRRPAGRLKFTVVTSTFMSNLNVYCTNTIDPAGLDLPRSLLPSTQVSTDLYSHACTAFVDTEDMSITCPDKNNANHLISNTPHARPCPEKQKMRGRTHHCLRCLVWAGLTSPHFTKAVQRIPPSKRSSWEMSNILTTPCSPPDISSSLQRAPTDLIHEQWTPW